MSDEMTKQPDETDDMLPEYDFSGGVRGKHYRAYQRGYTIIVQSTEQRKNAITSRRREP